MEITLASSPEVDTYMSDRIKVAEYHAIYINFQKLVKAKKAKKKGRVRVGQPYLHFTLVM